MELNDKQKEAVNYTEGPLLILAGAGSGKTTVLINRIYHLISDLDIPPYNILAITFTNKAADELKNRLEAKLGDSALDIWACTFHSACVRILRYNADCLGYDKYFSIYDTSDSQSLIKHILKDMNLDEKYFQPKSILSEISNAKDSLIMPEDFLRFANINNDLHKIKLAEIYLEYTKRMKQSNAMDFDDLLLNAVTLLKNNVDIRNYWINRFKYILVDEYQDTNKLQYMLISLLTGPEMNICVVGDDDQSIYKFRGATIENILNFEDQFNNCKVIRLEQNYRSTGHILNAANNVIKNNSERKGKELWTNRGLGEKVNLYVADNQDSEASYVSSIILNGIVNGYNFKDYAVLYRMNAQSNSLEYAFKRNGIPYRIIGGTRFFDRAEVKDIISYLHVINSPNDNLRLERIINTPARGIGSKALEAAQNVALSYNLSLFDVISNASQYSELAKFSVKLSSFAELIDSLRKFAENNNSVDIYDELIEKTGYIRFLEEKNTVEDTSRIENVKELRSSIISYIQNSDDTSLEGYLSNVSLYTDLDNYDNDSNCVVMMTMHSSKGLEFPNVFVVGMEETIFPGMKAIGIKSEMEEERRLCYVAITRAKDYLYLVAAKQRMLFGYTNANRVSRFIEEIPEEDITKNIPKGYSFSEYGYSDYNANIYSKSRKQPSISSILQHQQDTSSLDYSIGDDVLHSAFGEGVITSMVAMGNDYLIEINFKKTGTKKLMLKAAAKYIKKI